MAAVLAAMSGGSTRRSDIAAATHLPSDVVDAIIEHLLATGVLTAETLATACPSGGCGGCGEPTGHGCSTASKKSPGPVLISLSRPPVV